MESVILGSIGIGIGLVLGVILSYVLIQGMQVALNNLANDYISFSVKNNYFNIIANDKVKLKIIISIMVVGLVIALV